MHRQAAIAYGGMSAVGALAAVAFVGSALGFTSGGSSTDVVTEATAQASDNGYAQQQQDYLEAQAQYATQSLEQQRAQAQAAIEADLEQQRAAAQAQIEADLAAQRRAAEQQLAAQIAAQREAAQQTLAQQQLQATVWQTVPTTGTVLSATATSTAVATAAPSHHEREHEHEDDD